MDAYIAALSQSIRDYVCSCADTCADMAICHSTLFGSAVPPYLAAQWLRIAATYLSIKWCVHPMTGVLKFGCTVEYLKCPHCS